MLRINNYFICLIKHLKICIYLLFGLQVISSSGGQIIAVQNPALALSESLSMKTSIPSKSDTSSPPSKRKKDEIVPSSIGAVSSTLLSDRHITRSTSNSNQQESGNSGYLPHLQQAPPEYRHVYSLNNAGLMENTSAVATLLNLSRKGATKEAYDKKYAFGHVRSDRESPSSSSSTTCTTSSGYPRPKKAKNSENINDVDANDDNEDGATSNPPNEGKDKEEACDIDENFLGEVKQEPMSPQGASPPRSDLTSLESASFPVSSLSYSTTPLTRHATRTKLKNE